jgi:DNA-binding winged helix-turn-helix (wHTH) protein/tetratricopeptide (TPR) repeat protein
VIWSFGAFELDDEHYELRRDGQVVELRRKVFDVLRFLVSHHDRVVTKDELLQGVWPGETIHEAVVAQNIAVLRKVLADSREAARVIQTVHGRGYRFVAAVERRGAAISSAAPGQARATLASPAQPFVGREHAMQELGRLLRAALDGRGRFAMLTGEPGIGKTRTLEELAAQARALGMRVLEGEGSPAYWPWTQVLRAALADADAARLLARLGDGGAELSQLMSELRGRFAAPPRPQPLDAAEARFRLFDAITSLLAQLARAQPLLLTFDDLHWADDATLHLLRFLSREVRPLPLLVVGTARDVHAGVEPARGSLLATLSSGTHVQRVHLSGLSPDATRELIAATVPRALSEPRLRELHALTEGNPFFLHEVLRLLADDGAGGEDGWRKELPVRVREVIGLRLRTLGADAQRVLSIASVIGRDFGVAVLEQVAGLPRAQLLELLAGAADARIVRAAGSAGDGDAGSAGPSGQYRFAHALIRESLYGALPEPERVRVHDQVGRALEALFGVDAGEHASELAHHFYRAASGGDVERAALYCVRAAEQALDLLAFEQAVFHYRRALEALACRLPIDEQRRFELKLALGSALFRAGEDGNPALLGAAAIARQLDRPDLLGRVVLSMCGWPRFGRRGRTANHDLYPLLSEALAADRLAPALEIRLRAALALNCPIETSLEAQVELSDRALELARAGDDEQALYDALLSRVQLTQAPEQTQRRLELATELLASAERLGERERIFTARDLRIQPLLALAEVEAADREIEACAQLAGELRLRRCSLQVLRLRLERALGDGRLDDIRPLTEQAVHVRGKAAPSPGYMVSLFVWRTFERALRGHRPWFDRNIAALAAAADKTPLVRAHVAYLYALFGRRDDARACYQPLIDGPLIDARRDEDWSMIVVSVSEAVAACADRAAAEFLYPRLLPHAALNVVHYEWLIYFGSAAHWLGQLAAVLGQDEAATAHFEAALAANARLGARAALARTSVAYARTLLARSAASADEAAQHAALARSRALLRDAGSLADELGMASLAREARELAP